MSEATAEKLFFFNPATDDHGVPLPNAGQIMIADDPPANVLDPQSKGEANQAIMFMGLVTFCLVCHVGKPVAAENMIYLENRIKAVASGIEHPTMAALAAEWVPKILTLESR